MIDRNNPILSIENGTQEQVAAWRTVDWRVAVGDHDFTIEGNMDLVRAFRKRGIPYSLFIDSGEHDGKWVLPRLEDAIRRADSHFRR